MYQLSVNARTFILKQAIHSAYQGLGCNQLTRLAATWRQPGKYWQRNWFATCPPNNHRQTNPALPKYI